MSSLHLSKSQFLRGLQCHKSLWLYKNKPELRTQPDASQQALYDPGTDVGILAQELFPGGKKIEFEGTSFDEKIKLTRQYIESGVNAIYEATFQHGGVLAMVDILHKSRGGWTLYEVKASTSVKPVHEEDVAVQYYVLTGSGLTVSSVNLIHVNNQYIRNGALEIDKLFAVMDLTETAIGKQNAVEENLQSMRDALKEGCPKIDIGPHCGDPYECDFSKHCWGHIPKTSIFDLNRLWWSKKWELYNQGILKFNDLPDDYPLTPGQKLQVESELTGKETINEKGINEFLDEIHYPLYFLDFETFQQAVPRFDNLRPYEQIPFQYSLHILEEEDGKLKHKEFLAKEGTDPRQAIAKSLVDNIPNDVCVMVYNASFEKRFLKYLANLFPEYSESLMNIQDCVADLMVPFQRKYIYTKEMKGSYSIKYVLPALAPELRYEDLEISNGGDASSIYSTLHLVGDRGEVEKIRKALLEYCKLDTFGMVRLLEKLKDQSRF